MRALWSVKRAEEKICELSRCRTHIREVADLRQFLSYVSFTKNYSRMQRNVKEPFKIFCTEEISIIGRISYWGYLDQISCRDYVSCWKRLLFLLRLRKFMNILKWATINFKYFRSYQLCSSYFNASTTRNLFNTAS